MLVHTARREQQTSGDLLQKASITQILLSKEPQKAANNRLNKLEVTEADRLIMEDQIQIEEENQVGDRPRAVAAPSQLTSISGIYDKDRAEIASKKEEAIKHLQKKKPRGELGQVEYAKHKKQKSQHREMTPTLAHA